MRPSQKLGRRKGIEDSLGKRREPCQASGERPGAPGKGEGDGSAGREREKQGARPGIGKGPGEVPTLTSTETNSFPRCILGPEPAPPATLLPFLSLAPK